MTHGQIRAMLKSVAFDLVTTYVERSMSLADVSQWLLDSDRTVDGVCVRCTLSLVGQPSAQTPEAYVIDCAPDKILKSRRSCFARTLLLQQLVKRVIYNPAADHELKRNPKHFGLLYAS